MDLLIGEIDQLRPDAEEWAPKIKVLQENTEHHMEEEETELFPKVRKIWSAERRAEVGRKVQEMHDKEVQKKAA